MHFGATLHLLRTHAGLSLRAMAGDVGVSAAYLSRVENGVDPTPTRDRAAAIARALGVPDAVVAGLVDEIRGDSADWLRATSTGRRLVAELRQRELTEPQLARLLAFVLREFPADGAASSFTSALALERVLLSVRLPRLDEAWTVASLRLGVNPPHAPACCVGAGTAIAFARGRDHPPRACLLVCDIPVHAESPDGDPVRVVWVLADVPDGPAGVTLLASAARFADPSLVARLVACPRPEAALELLRRFERSGT